MPLRHFVLSILRANGSLGVILSEPERPSARHD
jgi:hypothetical protein